MTNTLDPVALERLRPLIELELRRLLQGPYSGDGLRIAALLRQVFIHLCGGHRSRDEQRRFLCFAAPIAREVAVGCAATGLMLEEVKRSLLQFNQWFYRLQTFDPVCTRIVELYYFGGLNARDTAAIMGLSRESVIRELRFAKAWWLQARMREFS
ncbi:MAG: ECF-type sigma factor [Steroidobacteraceae bacterium]